MTASMRIASVRLLSKTRHYFSSEVAVQPGARTVHHQPASTRFVFTSVRCNVCLIPVAFLHKGRAYGTQSSSVTVTEEPDLLFQKLSVLVKSHDKAVLDSYEFFATLAAKELGLTLAKVFEPPKNIERLTLLKSVHIFKKHRVQYEMRTHYRCIEISRITGSTSRVYLEYIQRNLPEGVAMEVTKTAIEKVPDHIQMPLWSVQSQEKQGSQ
ncbi:probable 28S ribosomal protein S10, mitochondrial isoform X1 [Pygocentrus nattereri]|uniref:probable 28S ribosomal protein S10, mitochondrial isoform X1 n=1 Tax=Pygocentrus nattereri TaxID=42514 RepID=UPI0008145ED6|nr:probable 28S ribosomal protein S10, mitochondrial isoform X1 [Pygocentrus nattereri]